MVGVWERSGLQFTVESVDYKEDFAESIDLVRGEVSIGVCALITLVCWVVYAQPVHDIESCVEARGNAGEKD